MDLGSLERAKLILKLAALVKNSILINLRVLISNITIYFEKFPNKAFFLPKLKVFYFIMTNSGMLTSSITNSFLKLHTENTQVRQFLSQIYNFFVVVHGTLDFDKFRGVDFKFHSRFLKVPK